MKNRTCIFQVIRSLEDKLFNIIEIEAQRRDKELKKMKMRCELMAQMQINSRLSEINAFLDKRAEEQSMNDQERDRISEKIQKDLSERLQQSSQELSHIKNQLKGILFQCQFVGYNDDVCFVFRYGARNFRITAAIRKS